MLNRPLRPERVVLWGLPGRVARMATTAEKDVVFIFTTQIKWYIWANPDTL